MQYDVREIASHFEVEGDLQELEPFGSGHINDTFRARYVSDHSHDYLHQRINHHVFKSPEKVMDNMQKVTAHLWDKLSKAGEKDPGRRCLRLIPRPDGGLLHKDSDGNYWRTMDCISGVENLDSGDIFLNGSSIRELNRSGVEALRRESIGYIFQSFHLSLSKGNNHGWL